jgi:hypothetical protein
VTNEGETNIDWLFETFIVVVMIWTKLSAVTGTDAPLNTSWQVTGSVSPRVLWPLLVQPTAVLIAAVAFELAVCANAALAASNAIAIVPAMLRTNALIVARGFMDSSK